ncbi:hypothetical protein PFISCL1PPCAC_27662 [Pristionchus fissidentatus]|uniref:Uncharacterized protein n=1 Tax=Pristionchus fissidentatus TaxID=1538716 RepID=A0AAV5WXZ0_9BILA|nr:hypothetical protein PFISCL1PPCAC_27662 [Pristionchus fissidentatus]
MISLLLVSLLAASTLACDLTNVPEANKELAEKVCALEQEMRVAERVLQELLQRADLTVSDEEFTAPQEKRKNEFIRFGKRSADGEMEKRKNEFIRFGKRKNEFIRFGRSAPVDGEMTKRKNEFIRFG